MVDADLAALYGVPTKRLNEQVKRNLGRFPFDFVFQLSRAERDEVVANCDHLNLTASIKICSLIGSPAARAMRQTHGEGAGDCQA